MNKTLGRVGGPEKGREANWSSRGQDQGRCGVPVIRCGEFSPLRQRNELADGPAKPLQWKISQDSGDTESEAGELAGVSYGVAKSERGADIDDSSSWGAPAGP